MVFMWFLGVRDEVELLPAPQKILNVHSWCYNEVFTSLCQHKDRSHLYYGLYRLCGRHRTQDGGRVSGGAQAKACGYGCGVDELIVGSEKLRAVYGKWPRFHDAEVIEVHLWR